MDSKYLSIKDAIIKNGSLYTIDIDSWLFIEYNLNTGEKRIIVDIQPKDYDGLCWIQKILTVGDRYYFIQRNSKGIVQLDNNGDIIRYGEEYELGNDTCLLYMTGFVSNSKIYMLPYYASGVISVFDIKSNKYESDISMSELLSQDEINDDIIGGYVWNHGKDTIWFCVGDKIIEINMHEMKSRIVSKLKHDKPLRISGNENNIVIYEKEGNYYYLYNTNNKKLTLHELEEKSVNISFVEIIQNKIAIISGNQEKLYLSDIDDNNYDIMSFPEESELKYDVRRFDSKYSGIKQVENKLYCLPFSTNGIVVFDNETRNMKFFELIVDKNYILTKNIKKIFRSKKILIESETVNLKGYCKYCEMQLG